MGNCFGGKSLRKDSLPTKPSFEILNATTLDVDWNNEELVNFRTTRNSLENYAMSKIEHEIIHYTRRQCSNTKPSIRFADELEQTIFITRIIDDYWNPVEDDYNLKLNDDQGYDLKHNDCSI